MLGGYKISQLQQEKNSNVRLNNGAHPELETEQDGAVAKAGAASGDLLDLVEAVEEEAVSEQAEQIAEDRAWLSHRLLNVRTLLSFALALGLLAFIFTRFDLDPAEIWQVLKETNLLFFAAGFVVYYSAFILRGLRWRTLLSNVGLTRKAGYSIPGVAGLIEIIYLSWFVNCIVPAKLGDAYRSYLLKRNADVSFSRTIGTILAERIIDLLILFSLLCVSAFLTFQGRLPGDMNLVLAFGALLVVIILGGLIALRGFSQQLLKLIPERYRSKFQHFQHGTLQSFRRRSIPMLIGFTASIWLLEGGRLFFVTQALDQGHLITLPIVIFIALASSLLTTLPVTPGGIGLVEGAVVVVLVWVGVDQPTAISIALLDRLINYWSIVVGGLVVYLVSKKK